MIIFIFGKNLQNYTIDFLILRWRIRSEKSLLNYLIIKILKQTSFF